MTHWLGGVSFLLALPTLSMLVHVLKRPIFFNFGKKVRILLFLKELYYL